MAVLKENPVAFFGALLQQVLSLAALALAKRNLDNLLVATRLSDLLQRSGGVGSLTEHEDDWEIVLALIDYLSDARRSRRDKLLIVHALLYEIADSKVDAIRAEASEDDHLLDRILTLGHPFTRELSVLRLWGSGLIPVLPLLGVDINRISDAREGLW